MKKMRLPLLIVFGIAVIGLIFGSIFDLQISQAIGDRNNAAGLAISVIGQTISFCFVAFVGGGFLALALQKRFSTLLRVLFWIAVIGIIAVAFYGSGKEYFGVNGFAGKAPSIIGYLIAAIPLLGSCFFGYWTFRKDENPNTWLILLIAAIAIGLIYVGPVTLLKEIMHRPRFRSVADAGLEFHAWWQRCGNYKELMQAHNLTSEEFKSFPSGHTSIASFSLIVTTLIPLAAPKFRKIQLPLFCVCALFCMLMGFGRVLAGAHFLSDVSMGLTLGSLVGFIGNEVLIHVKRFHQDEENLAAENK